MHRAFPMTAKLVTVSGGDTYSHTQYSTLTFLYFPHTCFKSSTYAIKFTTQSPTLSDTMFKSFSVSGNKGIWSVNHTKLKVPFL